MKQLEQAIQDSAQALGLETRPAGGLACGTAYGFLEGYPVQILAGKDDKGWFLQSIVRHDDLERDDAARAAVAEDPDTYAQGVAKGLETGNGFVIATGRKRLKGETGPSVADRLGAIVRAVARAVPAPGRICRLCAQATVERPVLANGVVDRVCPPCLDRIVQEVREAQAELDAQPTNLVFASAAAGALALAGALVWAGVVIATNVMAWLVAIGIGYGIGWGTRRAAGKGGRPVQVLVFAAALLSILAGQVMILGHALNEHVGRQGMEIDWIAFLLEAPGILFSGELAGDTLFALGGGLFGAFYAAGQAGREELRMEIER